MKLLIDENLPDALVDVISERFPGSTHVKQLSLTTTDDEVIWRLARDNGFALLTQDSDFERKAAVRGAPPKVILVRTGNIRTPLLRPIIAAQLDRIERFLASATDHSGRRTTRRCERSDCSRRAVHRAGAASARLRGRLPVARHGVRAILNQSALRRPGATRRWIAARKRRDWDSRVRSPRSAGRGWFRPTCRH